MHIGYILALIWGIAVAWYFYIFLEMNSYLKNVIIWAVARYGVGFIKATMRGSFFNMIGVLVLDIIMSLAIVKIMEFIKSKTNGGVIFVVLTLLGEFLCAFLIGNIIG